MSCKSCLTYFLVELQVMHMWITVQPKIWGFFHPSIYGFLVLFLWAVIPSSVPSYKFQWLRLHWAPVSLCSTQNVKLLLDFPSVVWELSPGNDLEQSKGSLRWFLFPPGSLLCAPYCPVSEIHCYIYLVHFSGCFSRG